MNDLIVKDLKKNNIIYILLIVLYAFLMLITFLSTVFWVLFGDFSAIKLFILFNHLRIILVMGFLLYGLVVNSKLKDDEEYLDTYMRKYSIWKGVVISCLLSPFFIILTNRYYRISQKYLVANLYSDNNDIAIKRPIQKKWLVLITVISSIIGSIVIIVFILGSQIASYKSLDISDTTEEVDENFVLPDIRLHYFGNETNIFDGKYDFSVMKAHKRSEVFSYDNKEYHQGDMVEADSKVTVNLIDLGSMYLTFVNDKECKLEDMKLNTLSISYNTMNNLVPESKLDSVYISINNNIIDRNTDYSRAREILKTLNNNCTIIQEFESNGKKAMNVLAYDTDVSNYGYYKHRRYSINMQSDEESNKVAYINITVE